MTFILFLCAILSGACATLLVLHRDYEDGLIGRVALSLIAIASFAKLLEISDAVLTGEKLARSSPIGMVLWIGLSIFLVRHCARFLRRCRRHEIDWRIPKIPEAPGNERRETNRLARS